MGNNYAVDGVNNLTVPKKRQILSRKPVWIVWQLLEPHMDATRGTPHIDFERLKQLVEACGDTPLVLHGGSGTGMKISEKQFNQEFRRLIWLLS